MTEGDCRMNTELKERKDTDPAYHWDLSTLYANDEAWQRELDTLEGLIQAVEQRQGTLHDAEAIRKTAARHRLAAGMNLHIAHLPYSKYHIYYNINITLIQWL